MGSSFLTLILLLTSPASSISPNYAIQNIKAILPGVADQGIPALPIPPQSPNPPFLIPRQEKNQCPAGQHSCVEVDAAGLCCGNDRYCYINQNWDAKCCSLGNKCQDSICSPEQLYCNTTQTLTVSVASESNHVTFQVVHSTSPACCNRACSASSFSCESAFGGQCCPYGFKCASSSLCIADQPPSTTGTTTILITDGPRGVCTATSQVSCDGNGGCCDAGSTCTVRRDQATSTALVCAPDLTLGQDRGLSSGAKAGIGVGVTLGAAAIIGAMTWFCLRRRRRARSEASVSAHAMQRNPGGENFVAAASPGRGSGRAGRGVGGGHRIRESLLAAGPLTPWTGRSNFSDASGPTISSARPPLHDHGRVYSYFGPDAMPGPYTDQDDGGHERDHVDVGTPPMPSDTTGQFMTPGSMPFHPDHIMRPVEIGGIQTQQKEKAAEEKRNLVITSEEAPARVEEPVTTHGPFELVGSLPSPSPLNSEDKGPSPPPADGRRK